MQPRLFVVFVGCAALVACSGGSPLECRVGADCASGVCLGNGTCGEPLVSDAGEDAGAQVTSDGGVPDSGTVLLPDGGTTNPDAGVDAGTPLGCQLTDDGRIERSEVFFRAGLRATYKISGAATFSTAGTSAADGGTQWDFKQALAGDASRLVETKALTGEWYESKFPDAGYVSELSQDSDVLGVFSVTDDALYLQGVVSPASDAGTELHYAPWVKVLQFPLQPGASWATTADVSGTFEGKTIGTFATIGFLGLPFQQDTYTSTVDRAGLAKTPYFDFNTLRVRTVLERFTRIYTLNSWSKLLTKRTFSWNAECFGTVATVASTDNEASTEFTNVTEVRRLSP